VNHHNNCLFTTSTSLCDSPNSFQTEYNLYIATTNLDDAFTLLIMSLLLQYTIVIATTYIKSKHHLYSINKFLDQRLIICPIHVPVTPCLFLCFKNIFLKIEFYFIFLCLKLIFFFVFSDHFNVLISKIILKNFKKISF
jgi:hypothetical protein